MGFNFPASPSVGQTYTPGTGLPVYRWDGEKWRSLVAIAATASALISDTVPGAPVDGMLWWESDTGMLYIRYNDGDSTQWVLVGNFPSLTGVVRYDAVQALSDLQKRQSRLNIGAELAPRVITGADTITAADYGRTLIFNSASNITVAIAAGATLWDGWYCDIYNFAAGVVTIDPNASEAIDGVVTASIYREERMRINYNSGGFFTTNHVGDWLTWNPVWSGSGGGTPTVTSLSRYLKKRNLVHFNSDVTITAVASGVGYLQGTLPVNAAPSVQGACLATETAVNGMTYHGPIGGSTFYIRKYDNTTSIIANLHFSISGTYECAK